MLEVYINVLEAEGQPSQKASYVTTQGTAYTREAFKILSTWQPRDSQLVGYRKWLSSWRGDQGLRYDKDEELMKWRKRLVKLYLDQKRPDDALPLMEAYTGPADPERIRVTSEAVRAYVADGKVNEALALIERTPLIDKGVVRFALDKCATKAFTAQNFKQSRDLLSRLLEMEEQKSQAWARVAMRRGNALYCLKEIHLAQVDLQAALGIIGKDAGSYDADLPWLYDALGHTGEILAGQDKEQIAKAMNLYKTALQLSEKQGGKDWGVETARIAFSYARTLRQLGQDAEAEQIIARANQAVYAEAARNAEFRARWKIPGLAAVVAASAADAEARANAAARQADRESMMQFQQQTANYMGAIGLEWRMSHVLAP